jgi:hypothetical protein
VGWWKHSSLLVILALNFLIRFFLEHHDHVWYLQLTKRSFPLSWALLLPVYISDDQCVWITSSMYPIDVLTRLVGTSNAFYVLNALVIVSSYVTGWFLTRSRTFACTLAACMAFGTQFHYGYVLSGAFCMYVQVAYLESIVLCGFKMLTAPTHRGWWRAGFLGMLSFMAFGFDTWLNFYVFLVFAGAFLYWFYWRRGDRAALASLRFALIGATVLLCIYLPVKLVTSKQHFRQGHEDEVILSYRQPILIAEDFCSNLITYTFMATTNYLPPALVTSNSDLRYGAEKVLAEQHGYHNQYSAHVVNHHLFLWYYHAGMIFAAYLYLMVLWTAGALRTRSLTLAILAVLLIGIGTGSATHVMIKYRPYMSVPALSYKCMPSILAVTYLIAFALMKLRQRFPGLLSAAVVCGCWALVLAAGLTRLAMLSHLQTRVGLAALPVDPVARLRQLTRGKCGPLTLEQPPSR